MNNCSKIKCPLNALTFKDCNLTEKECCYFTKQLTNGDVIKALFPNAEFEQGGEYIDMVMGGNSTFEIDWWNSPYKGGDNV